MATTLSNGSVTLTPLLVLGYKATQDSKNVIHAVLGKTSPDVTLRKANMRSGTLEILFLTAAEAEAARQLHIAEDVFTLDSSEITQINMQYVVNGEITTALEDETRNAWVITIDYQEVSL